MGGEFSWVHSYAHFSSIYLPPAMISKTGRNCLLLFGFLQEKQSLKKWFGPFFCISFSRRFLALFIIRQTAWSETDFFFFFFLSETDSVLRCQLMLSTSTKFSPRQISVCCQIEFLVRFGVSKNNGIAYNMER